MTADDQRGPQDADALSQQAAQAEAAGDFRQAEAFCRQAIALHEERGVQDDDLASALNDLAELLRTQHRLDEARPLYERALAMLKTAYGSEHPQVAAVRANHADCQRQLATARSQS